MASQLFAYQVHQFEDLFTLAVERNGFYSGLPLLACLYCIISVFAVFHLPIGLTLACIEVNSDHGAQTLLNLAVHGMHFERYMASTLAEAVATFGNLFVTTSETKLYKPWPNQGPLLMIYG